MSVHLRRHTPPLPAPPHPARYSRLRSPLDASLLAHLVHSFLPGLDTRLALAAPATPGVDFRATCLQEATPVELGFVCSICLAVYARMPDACAMCNSPFDGGVRAGAA